MAKLLLSPNHPFPFIPTSFQLNCAGVLFIIALSKVKMNTMRSVCSYESILTSARHPGSLRSRRCVLLVSAYLGPFRQCRAVGRRDKHVVLELLKGVLLLVHFLLQLQKLLLLTHTDGIILVGLLTLGKRIPKTPRSRLANVLYQVVRGWRGAVVTLVQMLWLLQCLRRP